MKLPDESFNRQALKLLGALLLSGCVVKFRFQCDVISRFKRGANQLHMSSRHSIFALCVGRILDLGLISLFLRYPGVYPSCIDVQSLSGPQFDLR
ncbi:hypothetical protein KC338_g48 [Hortaea werneckii]|nr:hypothetical protein KC338_g48 [Hortaea werneckii]